MSGGLQTFHSEGLKTETDETLGPYLIGFFLERVPDLISNLLLDVLIFIKGPACKIK